jgi:4-hydroxy-3-methylbut-2-enyl diphosphate reductase
MRFLVAKTSGFCFGVQNAVKKAYGMVDDPAENEDGRVRYMLGPLIHNEEVVDDLVRKGFTRVDRVEDVPEGACVLIRTHGIPPSTRDALVDKNTVLVDCTCPYVARIHRIARKAAEEGNRVLIAGTSDHPEVVGIVGECGGRAAVVSTAEEAESIALDETPCILVSQTTFSSAKWLEIRNVLQKRIANIQIFDTICVTTEDRQKEARIISAQVDVMLVVGSRKSSNTMKLLEVCLGGCGATYLIEHIEDVFPILAAGLPEDATIGITAGASTSESRIREVIQIMSEHEPMGQQEHADVSFTDFIDNIPEIHRGATIRGLIIRFDNESVYVDVKDKSEGKIPRHEFEGDPDFDLAKAAAEHLEIDVYVRSIRNTEMGKEILLSKARVDFGKYKALVEEAYRDKLAIKVKVVNVVKDGIIATYGGVDIYIHRTQLEMGPVDNLEEYKGKEFDILVTQYDPDRKRLRVSGSRRALLNTERKAKADEVWSTLERGNTYRGVVRSLTDFGAFVDIGGVDGLVHVSELSWKRIRHPSEVVKVGEEIDVYVKDFDPEKKRISLGFKRTEEDPYHGLEERFPVGSIVHGKVVRLFPFGAFIEIAPGVDALCHISQISNYRLTKPGDVLTEGLEVDARVLDVNPEARRISISIKDVEPIDPPHPEEGMELVDAPKEAEEPTTEG